MANNNWNNYTEKNAALTDKDEIMLRDSTDGKNKRSPLSKIWNYMVDKMATAVISKLETDNKTIIGAINYLYGKSFSISPTPLTISPKLLKTSYGRDYYMIVGNACFVWFNFYSDKISPANELCNLSDKFKPKFRCCGIAHTTRMIPINVFFNETGLITLHPAAETDISSDTIYDFVMGIR